ncbi:DUF302 domain-containing protein [Photobacterium profundum]
MKSRMEKIIKQTLLSAALFTLTITMAFANNGLISVKSSHNVKVTADKLEQILNDKGMTVFVRIDHSAGAKHVGEVLRPTELIIFGNPKVGTPLMQCSQSAAIDLPQKALISQDEKGQVWLTYNSPDYLVKRHNIKGCNEIVTKIETALANFSKAATMP